MDAFTGEPGVGDTEVMRLAEEEGALFIVIDGLVYKGRASDCYVWGVLTLSS